VCCFEIVVTQHAFYHASYQTSYHKFYQAACVQIQETHPICKLNSHITSTQEQ